MKDEKELVGELARVEAAEHASAVGTAERREHEKKRWEIVEKERALDERKWMVKENLEAVLKELTDEENTYKKLGDDEEDMRRRIKALIIEGKRRDLQAELDKIVDERGSAEGKLSELAVERDRVEMLLKKTQSKEGEIETEVEGTLKKISSAKTLAEERVLADTRYRLERERHDIEEDRWKTEDDIAHVRGDMTEAGKKLEEIKKKEAEVKKKLADLK